MQDLEKRTQKCRNNADEIVRIMASWNDAPLVTRKDGKSTEHLYDRKDYMAACQRRSVGR